MITYQQDDNAEYSYLMDGTEFEGVLNMMMRWFSESTSDYVRDWAEKFMVLDHCPDCKGARLKKESLWFRVAGKNIPSMLLILWPSYRNLFKGIEKKLSKKHQVISKDILVEIRDRLSFLPEVGSALSFLNRLYPIPERWRKPAYTPGNADRLSIGGYYLYPG